MGGVVTYVRELAGLARPTRLMLLGTLLKGLTVSIFGLNFPLYLASLGYGADTIGLVTAAMSFASFASTLPLGLVADRVGRRWILWTAGIGTAVTLLGMAMVESMDAILVWGVLNGLVVSCYWVVVAPVLTETTAPDARMRVFAVNAFLLWGVGAAGTILGGLVPEAVAAATGEPALGTGPLRAGLLAAGAMAVLGAVPLCLIEETRRPADPAAGASGGERDYRLLALLFLPFIAVYLGEGMIYPFLQLLFASRFGMEPGAMGAMLSLSGPVAGIATLLTPALAGRLGALGATVVSLALVFPTAVLLGFSPDLGLAVGAGYARSAFRSMASALYTRLVMERVPEGKRGAAASLDPLGYGVGLTVGPIVSGAMQVQLGFGVPFALGGLCYLTGAVVIWLCLGRSPTSPRGEPVGECGEAERTGVANSGARRAD